MVDPATIFLERIRFRVGGGGGDDGLLEEEVTNMGLDLDRE